jgi:hypothetical protein
MPTQITSAGITFNDATTLTSANIGTTQLVNGSVTAAKLGTNEQKQIAKAWVNFDGSASANINGTYVQSGTTVTVTTSTNHGLTQDQQIRVDITSGTAPDETVSVNTVLSPTSFTYISTSRNTSGSLILQLRPIRSSYNVSSVTRLLQGRYTINFTTPMADTNYSFFISSNALDSFFGGNTLDINYLGVETASNGTQIDTSQISVLIFGN